MLAAQAGRQCQSAGSLPAADRPKHTSMSSVFSRIIAGSIPGVFVVRDPRWVAFLDIQPVCPGHVLLVPVQESPLLSGLSGSSLAEMGLYLERLNSCVRQVLNCPATTLILRDGAQAGQEVPHLHWHIIPRWDRAQCHSFRPGRYAADEAAHRQGLQDMGARLASAWRGL